MKRLDFRLAGAIALGCLVPEAVDACPACFAASDGRVASMYLFTAALLSALPFAIVAAVAWWCRRHLGRRVE